MVNENDDKRASFGTTLSANSFMPPNSFNWIDDVESVISKKPLSINYALIGSPLATATTKAIILVNTFIY
jgi:hypothetical protein